MLLQPIIDRIKAQVAALSNRVGGTAEFAAATEMQESLPVPHAFVMPLADGAPDSLVVTGVVQNIEERFAVIVAVDNTAESRGQTASDALEPIRASLWAALLDWTPDADVNEGVEYRGGQHLAMNRARLWHQYDFASRRVISSF